MGKLLRSAAAPARGKKTFDFLARFDSLRRSGLSPHLDVLVLVLLVVLEEPPDLVQPVLGQLRNVLKVAVLRVVGVDRDDLVVAFALVDHLHHADGLGAEKGHGHDGLLHQDEDVERVVVLAERLGDEAWEVFFFFFSPVRSRSGGRPVEALSSCLCLSYRSWRGRSRTSRGCGRRRACPWPVFRFFAVFLCFLRREEKKRGRGRERRKAFLRGSKRTRKEGKRTN